MLATIEKWVLDPEAKYTQTPENTMQFVDFMIQMGRLKTRPSSWKECFSRRLTSFREVEVLVMRRLLTRQGLRFGGYDDPCETLAVVHAESDPGRSAGDDGRGLRHIVSGA